MQDTLTMDTEETTYEIDTPPHIIDVASDIACAAVSSPNSPPGLVDCVRLGKHAFGVAREIFESHAAWQKENQEGD